MNAWKVKVVNKNRFEITIVYNAKRGNRAIMPTDVFNQNFRYIDEEEHWAIKNDQSDHEALCKWLLDNGYMIRSEYRYRNRNKKKKILDHSDS